MKENAAEVTKIQDTAVSTLIREIKQEKDSKVNVIGKVPIMSAEKSIEI